MKKLQYLLLALLIVAILPMQLFANAAPEVEEKTNEMSFLTLETVYIEDYNTNEFTKLMEERTGIHISWETIPEQAEKEKLNLVLASGDYPDVFFGCSINDDLLTQYGATEKLFIPLNDLIKEHMPNLTKILDETPGAWAAITSPDGNIYGLPSFNECYHCENSNKVWVYKPFLDALGLDMPTTTEEFEEMLVAFKTQDPNGNGKADEIPYAAATRNWHGTPDLFFLNSFIYTDIDSNINASSVNYYQGFYVDNGKIKTVVNTEEYRNGLRYLHNLYEQGLIFPGSFTQDGTQLVQLVEGSDDPIVGVTAGGWGGCFSTFGSERYKNFRALEPLTGPEGEKNTPCYLQTPGVGKFVISTNCKDPVAAVEWADYLYSMEGTLNVRNGIENVSWRWAKEGEKGLDGKPAIWKELKTFNDTDPQNESYIEVGPCALTSTFRLGAATEQDVDLFGDDGLEKMLYEETLNKYRPYSHPEKAVPPLKFLPDEVQEYSTIKTAYANYVRQTLVQFIVGDLDIEKDWNSYIANLEKMNQQELLNVFQKAYDRQN